LRHWRDIWAEWGGVYLVEGEYEGGGVVAGVEIEDWERTGAFWGWMFGALGGVGLIDRGEINRHRRRIRVDT
jgi:hypothetical protein